MQSISKITAKNTESLSKDRKGTFFLPFSVFFSLRLFLCRRKNIDFVKIIYIHNPLIGRIKKIYTKSRFIRKIPLFLLSYRAII